MIARLKAGLTVANLTSAAAGLLLAVSPWLAGFTGEAASHPATRYCAAS
jgi:hypothetical protein